MQKINKWMMSNRLTINLSKKVYILVSNSKNCNTSNFHLSINDNELQRKNSVKYLGVYIDNDLKWKAHIEYLYTKLSATSYLLMKLRHYVDIKTLINVYNGLVYSNLHFSIIKWGKAYPTTGMANH